MAPAKKPSPRDELAAVDQRIAELDAEREAISARQGDAEGLLKSYDSRRSDARLLRRFGEDVEVPDDDEPARLQQVVREAKEEQADATKEKAQREEERMKVIAAGLPHFDAEAEEAARALEAECEAFLAHLDVLLAKQAAKKEAWRRSRDGRRELKVERPSEVGFNDLGDVGGKVKDVMLKAWPGESEARWRAFKAAEGAPPAARVSNAEALAQFAGEK